ncbi:MAG: hypothetical protein H0X40_04945 [Chthoniobacterales bacterium]|nr:hypothetical protein [Chthoniobacterales bacterium]
MTSRSQPNEQRESPSGEDGLPARLLRKSSAKRESLGSALAEDALCWTEPPFAGRFFTRATSCASRKSSGETRRCDGLAARPPQLGIANGGFFFRPDCAPA